MTPKQHGRVLLFPLGRISESVFKIDVANLLDRVAAMLA